MSEWQRYNMGTKDSQHTMTTEMAELAGQRSAVFGFLAIVFRKELTFSLLGRIKDPAFGRVLSDLGSSLGDEFYAQAADELLDELAIEYTALFLGPGRHISPHESVHHERDDGKWGQLWGDSTVEVKKFIETLGLMYKESDTSIPDHISVEMEMMQKLIEREQQAWGEGKVGEALYCLKTERMFMEDHIAKWVPQFCSKVEDVAEMTFYREMAKVTRSFIELERGSLDSYVSKATASA